MRVRMVWISTLALVMLVAGNVGAQAATITIINSDSAGEGFNDPTTVAPVGGNPGTTVGAQRLAVFQEAARIWGRRLSSNVAILVQSNFDPLPCGETSGVLGAASPVTVVRNFGSGAIGDTWYVIAQGNAMAGNDLRTDVSDIVAQFQSNLGQPGCLPSLSWYYGLDGNQGANQTDLLATVLHELGHGLGFLSLVNESTGEEFSGFIDVFSRFLFDNDAKKSWTSMSNAERQASAINDGDLVWSGSNVTADALDFLDEAPVLQIDSGPLAGSFEAAAAAFGASLTSPGVSANLVLVDDGSGASSDLCQAIVNGAAVNGNIAVIDRGTCAFTDKVIRAQNAGAVGAVVINNEPGSPFSMTGNGAGITIPAIMIRQDDGAALKAELAGNTVAGTVRVDPTLRAGADDNDRVRLYAPPVVAPGSSVSHWDVAASPNLLMEPFITASLGTEVDLTRSAFLDIGWPLNPVPVAAVSGLSAQRGEFEATVAWHSTGIGPGTRVGVHRSQPETGRVLLATLGHEERAYTDRNPPSEAAEYWLSVTFESGEQSWFGPAPLAASNAIAGFRLAAARPNPFGGQTTIWFVLPEAGRVTITVHDLRGRRVATLENAVRPAGSHGVTWDGRGTNGAPAAAGVYFARVVYGEQHRAQKLALMR